MGVGLRNNRINVAVVIIHAHARRTQDIGDIGGGCFVIRAQLADEVRLDDPDFRRPRSLEASLVFLFEDELLFAFCFDHVFLNFSRQDSLSDL